MGYLASVAKSTCYKVSLIFNLWGGGEGGSTASPNPPQCRSTPAISTNAQKTFTVTFFI